MLHLPNWILLAYVTVPILETFSGNTSEGLLAPMSFKHNTFRMWGYFDMKRLPKLRFKYVEN